MMTDSKMEMVKTHIALDLFQGALNVCLVAKKLNTHHNVFI